MAIYIYTHVFFCESDVTQSAAQCLHPELWPLCAERLWIKTAVFFSPCTALTRQQTRVKIKNHIDYCGADEIVAQTTLPAKQQSFHPDRLLTAGGELRINHPFFFFFMSQLESILQCYQLD